MDHDLPTALDKGLIALNNNIKQYFVAKRTKLNKNKLKRINNEEVQQTTVNRIKLDDFNLTE